MPNLQNRIQRLIRKNLEQFVQFAAKKIYPRKPKKETIYQRQQRKLVRQYKANVEKKQRQQVRQLPKEEAKRWAKEIREEEKRQKRIAKQILRQAIKDARDQFKKDFPELHKLQGRLQRERLKENKIKKSFIPVLKGSAHNFNVAKYVIYGQLLFEPKAFLEYAKEETINLFNPGIKVSITLICEMIRIDPKTGVEQTFIAYFKSGMLSAINDTEYEELYKQATQKILESFAVFQ